MNTRRQGTLCKRGHDDGTGHSIRSGNNVCVVCSRERSRQSRLDPGRNARERAIANNCKRKRRATDLVYREQQCARAGGRAPVDREALWLSQGKACALCRDPIDIIGHGSHVDHDHATGRIRGLLCRHCNVGLGKFKDDPARLAAAIAYLQGGVG